MIMPELNAFVLIELEGANGRGYWGRVMSMFATRNNLTMGISIAAGDVRTVMCPPATLIHCHHQPVDWTDPKTGKFYPGADDSDAWRHTREAFARAMIRQGPFSDRFFPEKPQEDA